MIAQIHELLRLPPEVSEGVPHRLKEAAKPVVPVEGLDSGQFLDRSHDDVGVQVLEDRLPPSPERLHGRDEPARRSPLDIAHAVSRDEGEGRQIDSHTRQTAEPPPAHLGGWRDRLRRLHWP